MSESKPVVKAADSSRPFVVVTVLVDSGARFAALTCSHGLAMDRAVNAVGQADIAGLDIIELPVAPKPFDALRTSLKLPAGQVGLYDLFPLASSLDPALRKIAGQFLAAEALWALEEQGALGGAPLHLKLDLPSGWGRDPKVVRDLLVRAGALELSLQAIDTFNRVKKAWDQSQVVA